MKPPQRILSALSFFSSRPNWNLHLSPAGECVPPFGSGGGGWGGGPIWMRGQTVWYSRYTCTVLCTWNWRSTLLFSYYISSKFFACCSPNAEQGLRSILQPQAHSGPTLPQGRRWRVQFCGRDTPDIFEHQLRCVSKRNSHCTLRPDTFHHPIFPGIKIAFQPGTYFAISFVVFLFFGTKGESLEHLWTPTLFVIVHSLLIFNPGEERDKSARQIVKKGGKVE